MQKGFNRKHFLLSYYFFLVFIQCSGQEQVDTLERFYNYNSTLRINHIEREHIPLQGDSVTMIPFRVDEKYGFVDKLTGNWLIEPKYKQVFAVYEEGAIVEGENGYGLIDRSDHIIIPLQYHNLVKESGIYRGSLFGVVDTAVKDESHHSYIWSVFYNSKGKYLFSENAHDFLTFKNTDSLAWFRYGRQYHIVSKSGLLVKSFYFNVNKTFTAICNNYLIFKIKKGDSFFYRAENVLGEKMFELLIDQNVSGIYQLSENLFGYYYEDGDYLFCDAQGNQKPFGVISGSVGFFRFSGDYFYQDYFVVHDLNNERYGLINHRGDTILPFKFRQMIQTGKDTYLADNQYFISHLGDTLLRIPFEAAQSTLSFYSMLNEEVSLPTDKTLLVASTRNEDQMTFYYVNNLGNVVLTLPQETAFASQFHHGLALVMDSTKRAGFIDDTGKLVIPYKYELMMAGSYPLPYLVVPEFFGDFCYIKSFKGYIDRKGKEYFSGKRVTDQYNFSH